MEIKKKLNDFYAKPGIFLKMGLFFMLVLSLQMILSTNSFASISYDYLDYSLNNMKTWGTYFNNCINKFYDTEEKRNSLLTYINIQLQNNNLSNLTDINLQVFNNGDYNFFVFSNASAPNGIDNLGFLYLQRNPNSPYGFYFGTTSTDVIYYISIYMRYNNPSVSLGSLTSLSSMSNSTSLQFLTDTYSTNSNILTLNRTCVAGLPSVYFTSTIGGSTYVPMILQDTSSNGHFNIPTPEPEEPSGDIGTGTGTITNSSGEVTGQIDLSGIEQGIVNIKDTISGESQAIRDTISGETEKLINSLTTVPNLSGDIISSGDVISKIDFSLIENNQNFTAYSNFWLTLINGLRGSLTGNKRSLDISFRGEHYVINLDDFTLQVPQELKFLLGMWSTIYFVILIVKWWKVIIDKLSSGDIDEVLQINEEERYCRFILGGAQC